MTEIRRDIVNARTWLELHCHQGHLRHVLERGLEYFAALDRAGLCPETIDAEDLYRFLSDPSAGEARHHAFVEPTM